MSKQLETEVWSLNHCAGCGLCVASCSKQVLGWDGGHHPVVEKRIKTIGYTQGPLDSCTFCQSFCEEVCPRLEKWAALEAQSIVAAQARGPVKSGLPNDVIRSILTSGRSAGLLDGIVLLDLDPWELKPVARVVDTVEEIVTSVGPQFLWTPIFDVLNEAIFDRRMENIAVVGTPCAAQAIRRLRSSSNIYLLPYQDSIRLSIAIFCTGIYRPEMVEEVLVNRMGIARDEVKRLEISSDRENLQAVLWNGDVHTIPRQIAEEYTLPGCGSCDDYLGESADLAIGTLGTPEDSSTLIIRSRVGDIFVRNALQMKLLETNDKVDVAALEAAAGEKDRRERAQAFKDLSLLMLDGLADPLQRNQAIKQFVSLYRTPSRSGAPERSRNGCTGC
jgi:coenzyme F420 hydrogenase subunit beta